MGKKKEALPCAGCGGSGFIPRLGNAICGRCGGSGTDPYAHR